MGKCGDVLVARGVEYPSFQVLLSARAKEKINGGFPITKPGCRNVGSCVPRKTPDAIFVIDDTHGDSVTTETPGNSQSVKIASDNNRTYTALFRSSRLHSLGRTDINGGHS